MIPLGRRSKPSPWSAAWFPVVGAFLGWVMLWAHREMAGRIPLAVEAALVLVGWAAVTGALHVDGLADTCDAWSARTWEEARRRMADPQVGAFGVTGVGLALIMKWSCFWAILAHRDPIAILAAPACGRAAMVGVMASLPYGGGGTGEPFTGRTRLPACAVAVGLTVAIGWTVLGGSSWKVVGSAAFVALAAWGAVKARWGVWTGDVAGAIGEVSETAAWVAVAAVTCGPW